MESVHQQSYEKAAFILKTVAHPTRLAVIDLLGKHEKLSVNEICKQIHCEQSLLSHHLIGMKLKGILSAKKEGQSVFYSLKEKGIIKVIHCIEHCNCNF